MGNRSLTIVKDIKDREIGVMYRHNGGDPTAHGVELAAFLKDRIIETGLLENTKTANGMDDLFAQLIYHFKKDSPVGNIYLEAAGTRKIGESYIYEISFNGYGKPATCTTTKREI